MNQLEAALVIQLRETIPWESAIQIADAGTLTAIDPVVKFDPRKYQRRDRELAFRDLVNAAAVAEVSVRVSDVWNFSTITPVLQGPVGSDLVNVPSEQSFSGTAANVRHVSYTSVPFDAAQYADKDLYGRDAIIYETLAQACSIFTDPPVTPIDMAGTIPQPSAWSLAQGEAVRADINSALPWSRDLFKRPDQNLADRDNQVAGYVARMAQVLKDPFAYANRIYVQVSRVDPREPEIYVLARTYWEAGDYEAGDQVFYVNSWYEALVDTNEAPTSTDWEAIDGPTLRTFVAEPALSNRNRIVYDTEGKTLQWFRELSNLVHVPQIAALSIPGIAVGQVLDTLPQIPDARDAQYWRLKAGQINPVGEKLTDEINIDFTATDIVTGGYTQVPGASLTVPDSISFLLGEDLQSGNYRVSVLASPQPYVEIAGAQNVQGTSGTLGGATFEVEPGTVSDGILYLAQDGNGIVYAGGTVAPNATFTGLSGTTAYTPLGGSTIRQYASVWRMALPVGAWKASIEYTNLSGTTDGFGIRALMSPPSGEATTVIQDTVMQPFPYGNGTLALSTPVGFDVQTDDEFLFPVYWTYGDGQLHIRRIVFESDQIDSGHYVMSGTLGADTSPLDVVGKSYHPDVMAFEFSTGSISNPSLSLTWTEESQLPVQLRQIHVQSVGTYTPTPNALQFQGWRQEMVDRAGREVTNAFARSVRAYGTNTPNFANEDYTWDLAATEEYMAFIEVHQPRLREMEDIATGDIRAGRQYEVTSGTVAYGNASYTIGQKFYGFNGTTAFTGGDINQVGAFTKAKAGYIGKPAILPFGLQFDDADRVAKVDSFGSNCFPVVAACQPWMIDLGIYVVQPEFWMPENT